MMALHPLLKMLVTQSAANYEPADSLNRKVRRQVDGYHRKVAEERSDWFNRPYLPRTSVLTRLPLHDREAMIAHFRAKELRNVADAVRDGNRYTARLARKRLGRVGKLARAFAEVDRTFRFSI